MSEVALIGIDLGKHVFHLHAQDRGGHELWRKKVTRKQLLLLMSNFPPCTLVMEACAGSHCLARELQALGHEAKLIAPQYVKPFVKGNKNDFVDAEAIQFCLDNYLHSTPRLPGTAFPIDYPRRAARHFA